MKHFYFLLVLVAFAFSSCLNEESSYTPYLNLSYFVVNPQFEGDEIVSAEDTLWARTSGDQLLLDTINIGDTVVFCAGFGSLGNELVAARINFDPAQLHMAVKLQSEAKTFLSDSSDVPNLQFIFNPGFNYIPMSFGYSAPVSGTHSFGIVVESDSKYSPTSFSFQQPVR